MGKKFTVKSRAHHGTNSLDITIPTQVCKENKINEGDVFSLEVTNDGKLLILNLTFKET
ncbi:MAG: AbrB/MazE/SpoVT family DNA-binding domain-containing protein [Candidatus Methanoperedens sp.]|nr:AbrB/MazE/SpoVT family DNA-binding domain-containing protein [Candidatus Methanoperedens sp.]